MERTRTSHHNPWTWCAVNNLNNYSNSFEFLNNGVQSNIIRDNSISWRLHNLLFCANIIHITTATCPITMMVMGEADADGDGDGV